MMIPITVTALCFLLQSSITSGRALAFNHHPNYYPLISRSLNLNFGRDLFAPPPPSATIKRRLATTTTAHLSLASNSDNDQKDDGDDFLDVNVAGVSVSPSGFIVLLQSILNIDNNSEKSTTVAFPISLTSPPNENPSSSSNTSNITMLPELFRENHDQTSVTSPEALTFLQLLNGVDMATPILPPDTLSLICVWYAFLLEEQEDQLRNGDEGGELVVVEDELGLSSATNDDEESSDNKFQVALGYIRAMVRTTLPPSSDGSDGITRYMDASPWQRARVKLPRAWLHRVRIQELEDHCLSTNSDSTGIIGRVPLQFILECSVDDGSKMLEIPLLAIPGNTSIQQQQQQQLDMSNEILQELSQNFNGETSAAFMSLALFHRYNKSGAGSADSPVLKVSHELLNQLILKEDDDDCQTRYCWVAPVPSNNKDDDKKGDEHEHDDVNTNSIDTIIQKNGLPLYRTLNQIQEEDQRVLQHLKQENFGDGDSSSASNNNSMNEEMDNNIQKQQQPKKKSLTLEQQAMQQRLTSAWKIATQREDAGALEKIQKAMEDLEKEVMDNTPDVVEEGAVEAGKGASSLQKIQRAMQQGDRSQQISQEDEGEEEEVVGLISELEEATSSRMQQMMEEEEEDK